MPASKSRCSRCRCRARAASGKPRRANPGNRGSPANLGACTLAARGCAREGTRTEKYSVYFDEQGGDKKEGLSCDFTDTAKWKSYPDGGNYKGKVRMLGGLDCDSLEKL